LLENIDYNTIPWDGRIGGALYQNDFVDRARQVGLTDSGLEKKHRIEITDEKIASLIGNPTVFSVTDLL